MHAKAVTARHGKRYDAIKSLRKQSNKSNMEEIQKGLGADRVLTEEEMELVNEFLQV